MTCRRWNNALVVLAVLGLPVLPGCSDGKPRVDTSLNEGTVTGIVMVKGKPAEGGTILFNASNSERIVPHRSAPIGKDGRYTITAYTGANQVSFDGDVANKNRGVGLIKEFADVARGENTVNFDLMGEGSGKKPMIPIPDKGDRRLRAKR